MSKIQWTDVTWNPTTGCSKVSPGCAHCYAERLTRRLRAIHPKYKHIFEPAFHPETLVRPSRIKGSKLIFVNSMSDLFHEAFSLDEIRQVFEVIEATPQHIFQILTKRPYRAWNLRNQLPWPSNLWLGISIETKPYLVRIGVLTAIPANIRFISFEPLLGPISLNPMQLEGIHWIIVGGETGPGARPMQLEWVTSIRDQCIKADIPFFFKQWSGRHKIPKLEGTIWHQMPRPKPKSR